MRNDKYRIGTLVYDNYTSTFDRDNVFGIGLVVKITNKLVFINYPSIGLKINWTKINFNYYLKSKSIRIINY